MPTLRDLASNNDIEQVKEYLQCKDIDYDDLYNALWDSVRYGYQDMVEELLKDDRILSISADKDNGCLLKAVEYEHVSIVIRLLQIPQVAKNKDVQRNSALLMAKLKCNSELIAILG